LLTITADAIGAGDGATLARGEGSGADVCVTADDCLRLARHRATRRRVVFCPLGLVRYLRTDARLLSARCSAAHSGEHGTGA